MPKITTGKFSAATKGYFIVHRMDEKSFYQLEDQFLFFNYSSCVDIFQSILSQEQGIERHLFSFLYPVVAVKEVIMIHLKLFGHKNRG